jgi:hypothetical protein
MFPVLVSGFSISTEPIFHFYGADFPYIQSGFSISLSEFFILTERIFHFERSDN